MSDTRILISRSMHPESDTATARVEAAIRSVDPEAKVWTPANVVPGSHWVDQVNDALVRSVGVVVIFGELMSYNVMTELALAQSRGARILLVTVSGGITQVPVDLVGHQTLSVHDPSFEDEVANWVESLPRPDRLADQLEIEGSEASSIDRSEYDAVETFLTAFYRAVDADTAGLTDENRVDAVIMANVVQMVMKSERPNRGVLKAALSALGGLLIGVGSNHLYALMPHIG
jgi:hypothetical protein